MKKVLAVILSLILILSLVGCKKDTANKKDGSSSSENNPVFLEGYTPKGNNQSKGDKVNSGSSSNATSDNKTSSSSQKSTSSETEKKITYEDIECEETDFYQTVRLVAADSSTQLALQLPYAWSIKRSGGTCNILYQGDKIGHISCNDGSSQYSTNEFSVDMTYSDIYLTHNINRINGTNSFIRVFSFTYEDADGDSETLVLTVNYEEIGPKAIATMFESMQTVHHNSNNISGALKIENGIGRILILGNSFIATSSIGNILQKMCSDDLTVEAISLGYANVLTYTNDSYIMESIQAGNYGAVFMCGFYDMSCADEFQKIVSACENSNTKLAIFPAHNEGRDSISYAKEKFPYATLVDWKAEINSFIASGHSETLFCANDSYKHSTPLAGYIGAHMVYRAVFGKIPPQVTFNEVSPALIASLGDYSTSGNIFDHNERIIIEK